MPSPDKFIARVIAFASALVAIGMVMTYDDISGLTAQTGAVGLIMMATAMAILGAVYRTRIWP